MLSIQNIYFRLPYEPYNTKDDSILSKEVMSSKKGAEISPPFCEVIGTISTPIVGSAASPN
ncbi:MAG: hypothetical protein APF81_18715 [Desulfosporosinus sp. BRH_c37]|nr:MAG: hypothetical protein APF81_18715 [Desulfosporosinus sp. BRH_c37]